MKKLPATRSRPVLALAALGVVVLLGLGFVAFGIVKAASTYTLTEKPATTRIPVFAANADAVPGWSQVANSGLQQDASGVPYVTYQNKAKTCKLVTTTLTYPVYLHGRGDLYLSKDALYEQATIQQQLAKQEATAYISTTGGKRLQVVTGYYSVTDPSLKAKSTARFAARAIDTLYKKPPSAVGDGGGNAFGLDPNLAVPVLAVTYTCDPGAGSTAEFQRLLGAVHVVLR